MSLGAGQAGLCPLPDNREARSYQERFLTLKTVDCLIKSVVEKALIQKRVHLHAMRHIFAATLLDTGNDLKIFRHRRPGRKISPKI